jgi:hypothetical protein
MESSPGCDIEKHIRQLGLCGYDALNNGVSCLRYTWLYFYPTPNPAGFFISLAFKAGSEVSMADDSEEEAQTGAKPLLCPFSYIQKTFDSGQPTRGVS